MDIREVAKRAGVSVATVSRTINNIRRVNPVIARKVWGIIDELGYYPNSNARALVSGRSRILGLIMSDITNPFFPELVRGFEEVAVDAGYEVLLGSTNYDPRKMAIAVRRMLERNVEGVAIMTSEMEESLVSLLKQRQVPLVFLDVGPSASHVSNICVNYRAGIRQAVAHLHRLGHRRLAFITGPLQFKSARIRREVFLQCLSEFAGDAAPPLIIESDHLMYGGYNAVPSLLGAHPAPTAVLCSNDLTAIGVLRGLDREGLRAPHDMSVIGFDDIHMAEFTVPALTTVRLSRRNLARTAFEALIADLTGRADTSKGATYTVDTRLIIRASTDRLDRKPSRPPKTSPKRLGRTLPPALDLSSYQNRINTRSDELLDQR
jgi:LacI family transcriptional regulator